MPESEEETFDPILVRQLRRAGNLSADTVPTLEGWQKFLGTVDKQYRFAADDRAMLVRSMEVSSAEMEKLSTRLEGHRNELQNMVLVLADALQSFGMSLDRTDATRSGHLVLVRARDELAQRLSGFFDHQKTGEVSIVLTSILRLADEVVRLLEETAATAAIRKEREVARAVQALLLPDLSEWEGPRFELAAHYEPADGCGGDWWSWREIGPSRVLVAVGDVTGHGMPAAILTGVAKAAFDLSVARHGIATRPSDVLRGMGSALWETAQGAYLMTAAAVVFDFDRREIMVSSAGQPAGYICNPQGVQIIGASGDPLGVTSEYGGVDQTLPITPGSSFLWFTDGVVEAEDPAGVALSEKTLRSFIRQMGPTSAAVVRDALVTLVAQHMGTRPQQDDVTFIACRFVGLAPASRSPSVTQASPSKGHTMQTVVGRWSLDSGKWESEPNGALDSARTLVLGFGCPEIGDKPAVMEALAKRFPRSIVLGCSTAGEIHGPTVEDKSLTVTVTQFERTDLLLASCEVKGGGDSFGAGQTVAKRLLSRPGLRAILVLSEGLNVNGSELVRGINSEVDESVVVTGGLSGDGSRFEKTWVAVGPKLGRNIVAAVGFYGDNIRVSHGSRGGWDSFGPQRTVTMSEANVVYEIDGKPALALYKEYLGEKAKDLPGSGLLFPLALREQATDEKFLVRTLLAVDETKQSLTFAGDVPQGASVQLMKADFDRLVAGAATAVQTAMQPLTGPGSDALVLAVSCVGRRLVLGPRIEEELEAIENGVPKGYKAKITGFYSYGEISPYASGKCDLHNQTLTLSVFTEDARGAAARSSVPGVPPARPTSPTPPSQQLAPAAVASKPAAPAEIPPGLVSRRYAFDVAKDKWDTPPETALDSPRTLVLAFGSSMVRDQPRVIQELGRMFPRSVVVGCSSAGEIHGSALEDSSVSVTVTRFEKSDLQLASFEVKSAKDSPLAGRTLAQRLTLRPKLRAVLVLSEGMNVNGSELVRGLNTVLDPSVVVTGGLAGDGTRFQKTWVAIGGKVTENVVAAVGFYGDFVQIGHGSRGGWERFGPERVVTKSEANVLYELDGTPALALYKQYLGDKASELPASGLRFPLALRASTSDDKFLVRTLLGVDEAKQSMTFAGDLPKGHLVQLMKADFDKLIEAASQASVSALRSSGVKGGDSLIVAVSCVGRRLVLGPRIEEELEAIHDAVPAGMTSQITGFYSYGEISPYASGHADLHNQTMTLTVIGESKTAISPTIEAPSDTQTNVLVPPAALRPAPGKPAQPPPPAPRTAPPPPATSNPALRSTGGAPPPAPAPAPGNPALRSTGGSGALPPASTRGEPTPSVAPAAPLRPALPPVLRVPLSDGQSAHTVATEKRGTVQLVRVRGRLTEAFKGEALGLSLRGQGTVVFDLRGVERITSFGVREWLAMLNALSSSDPLFFAQCSEAITSQLGMIRKFAGEGRVLSFFAPYLCDSCGQPFERLFDCDDDRPAIEKSAPPPASCPRCSGKGAIDDDATSYFAFAQTTLAKALPTEIRMLADELAGEKPVQTQDFVDKVVDGATTRIRVDARLTTMMRWRRVLEGTEGHLVVDLGGLAPVDAAATDHLLDALSALPSEVSDIRLERVFASAAKQMVGKRLPPRVSIASLQAEGSCAQCSAARPALLLVADHEAALRNGTPPLIRCRRCGEALTMPDLAWAHTLVSNAGPAPAPRSAPPPAAMPAVATPALASLPPVANAPSSSNLGGLTTPPPVSAKQPTLGRGLVAALVIGAAGTAFLLARGLPSGEAHPPATAASATVAASTAAAAVAPVASTTATTAARGTVVDELPAWAERLIVMQADKVVLVGKGGSTDDETSRGKARGDAILRLVEQLHRDLAGAPVAEFLKARVREATPSQIPSVVERYLAQMGPVATPERKETVLVKREGGTELWIRYELPRDAYDRALTFYKQTKTVQGMTVARVFPLLETASHPRGDLVILGVEKGKAAVFATLHEGDVLLSVNDRALQTPEQLERVLAETMQTTPIGGTVSLQVEAGGAVRTVKLPRLP